MTNERIALLVAEELPKHRTIVLMPGRCGGEPTVGDSRLPALQMAEHWWGGWTLEDFAGSWPADRGYIGMDRANVLVACWYQARYGSRTWRKRWGDWLQANERKLWAGCYDEVELPPQKGAP